jgi:hypothetical protein
MVKHILLPDQQPMNKWLTPHEHHMSISLSLASTCVWINQWYSTLNIVCVYIYICIHTYTYKTSMVQSTICIIMSLLGFAEYFFCISISIDINRSPPIIGDFPLKKPWQLPAFLDHRRGPLAPSPAGVAFSTVPDERWGTPSLLPWRWGQKHVMTMENMGNIWGNVVIDTLVIQLIMIF